MPVNISGPPPAPARSRGVRRRRARRCRRGGAGARRRSTRARASRGPAWPRAPRSAAPTYTVSRSTRPAASSAPCSAAPPSTIAWSTPWAPSVVERAAEVDLAVDRRHRLDLRPRGPPGVGSGGRRELGGDHHRGRGGVEQRTLGRHPAPGVEQHAQRRVLRKRVGVAHRERGAVGEGGAGTHHHGLGVGPQPVRVGPGGGTGDPLRRAVGRRGAAVDAEGGLDQAEGAPGTPVVEVGGELEGRGVGADAQVDRDPGRPQPGDALPRHQGRDRRARRRPGAIPACDQGVGTGRGPAVVAARFEGHVGGGVPGRVAGGGQSDGLGVGPPRRLGGPGADHDAVADEHAADPRVGGGPAPGPRGEAHGVGHALLVCGGSVGRHAASLDPRCGRVSAHGTTGDVANAPTRALAPAAPRPLPSGL